MISSTDLLKHELSNLKSKLEGIEQSLEDKLLEVNIREDKWVQMETKVNEIIQANTEKIIRLIVGGKKFATRQETFLRIRDSLFYKIAASDRFNLDQELFFDRSPKVFAYILDYLRGKKIHYDGLSQDKLQQLLLDADYYELSEISSDLKDIVKEIEFVRFERNAEYIYNELPVGTHRAQDLNDKSLNKGICATSPGWITIELGGEYEIEDIEIGGFNGDSTAWYVANGSGAQIQTSIDKNSWKTVGTIPSDFGATIISIRLSKSSGRYIKFTHNSYLGLGYLKIKKAKK